jgi:ABC-type Zn2+ transport system substrate-binding protein/surface adhesin
LEKPLDVFAVPAAAGCSATEAKVAVETEAHADHDHDDHDHDHDKDAKGGDDHHDHGDKAEGGHSHFHATNALDSTSPAELTTITFNYINLFAGAKELTVNVVGAKGQSSYEVSRDKPTLDLAGVM